MTISANKKSHHRRPLISEEALSVIMAAATQELSLMISLSAFCGLRAGEVCNLKWTDVDFGQLTLLVRYSENSGQLMLWRMVPLGSPVSEQLRHWRTHANRQQEAFIFGDRRGPRPPSYIPTQFRRLLECVRMRSANCASYLQIDELRFYDLRRFALHFWLDQQINPKE